MRVLIVHGYDDLSCPYFISRLVIDQIPVSGDPNRVKLSLYPGGHMFYSRPGSQASFRTDVMQVFGERTRAPRPCVRRWVMLVHLRNRGGGRPPCEH